MRSLLHDQIDAVFNNGGPLNQVFEMKHPDSQYSRREDQVRMSMTIATALAKTDQLRKPFHAFIEAGTGTGKSFGELVPYALRISQENQGCSPDEKRRVLVVTHTTTLQSQLYNDDIPEVQEVLSMQGLEFNAILLKGKGNYICTKRMKELIQSPNLSDNDKEELLNIKQKHCDAQGNLLSGDKEALPKMSDAFWSKINGSSEVECDNCPYKDKHCYYNAIKSSAKNADIMIGNHALLLNDLVSRAKGGNGIIPVDYHYLVIDEAHHVEQMLVDAFSTTVSTDKLTSTKKALNWILEKKVQNVERKKRVSFALSNFEKSVLETFNFFHKEALKQKKSIPWAHDKIPDISALEKTGVALNKEIAELQMRCIDKEVVQKLDKINMRVQSIIRTLSDFALNVNENQFHWIDIDEPGVVSLKYAPLDANKIVREVLFDRIPVTITSATIKLGDNLDVFANKLGDLQHNEFEQLCVKSPFDYKKNAVFYVPAYALGAKDDDYDEYCIEEMRKLVDLANGRSFLLFTSSETMKKYRDILAPYFESKGYPCLMQGDDDRRVLIEKFKKSKNAVLFGGDSFWEGIDIKGRILSMVVMQKIPFNVPNPLSTAKEKLVKAARPKEAFKECSVFPAIIKFKQGFGRLIRGHSDGGVVALLDGRVLSCKDRYGKYFLEELPEGMKRTVNFDELKEYIQ